MAGGEEDDGGSCSSLLVLFPLSLFRGGGGARTGPLRARKKTHHPPSAPPFFPAHNLPSPIASTPTTALTNNTTKTTPRTYADAAGAEAAAKYQTPLFLAASASAEFFADMALAPFEAVKVAVQTRPGFAKGLLDGMPKLVAADGVGG